jgi:protein SCO1/2
MDRRTAFKNALALLAAGAAAPAARRAGAAPAPQYFPNVSVTTHDGRTARFYEDLIKGRVVLLNFFYIHCLDGQCPLQTANLKRVQALLGDRAGREVFMYSITLQPEVDRPRQLRQYVEAFGIGPGWQFLTGKPADIELLRRRLGFVDPDPALDRDKSNHTGVLRYGNEAKSLWAACPALADPEEIVRAVRWVAA